MHSGRGEPGAGLEEPAAGFSVVPILAVVVGDAEDATALLEDISSIGGGNEETVIDEDAAALLEDISSIWGGDEDTAVADKARGRRGEGYNCEMA